MNDVMESLKQLFLTVLTFSAYAAAIAFVVMAVRALLGKKLPALFSCALWGIVMLRLLLPVPLPLPSVFDMMPVSAAQNVIAPGIQSTPDSVDMKDLSEATANRYEPLQQQNARVHAGQYTDSTKSIQARSFDAIAVAAMLWFAGIFVLVVRTTVVYAISRRKLNSAMPLGRSGFVGLCAAQMGTRYTGDMYLSDVSRVPVLFGLLHPRIILPASAARMTDEALKHVVLHELAHKKRGDMGVKALWSLLLFINWFNPVLWLADRLLARDMERACDEKVIRILGPESKKAYALSLLKSALDVCPQTGTNETLAFAKGGVKHRIENVLNFKKAGRAVTAVSLAIVLLLSAALLTACQPTPEKPVVAQRAEIEEKIEATVAPVEKYNAPKTWTDMVDMKGSPVEVTINAAVHVPDVDSFPIYKAEKASFTQNMIDSLMDEFVQGRNVFFIDYQETKAELEDQLIEAKRGQLIDGEYVMTEDSKRAVEDLQKRIDKAPETVDRSEQYITDFTLNEDGSGFHGTVELGDKGKGIVSATANEFSFTNGWYPAPESQLIQQYGNGVEGNMKISEEEAVQAAQVCLDKFGIDYMAPAIIEKALFYTTTNLDTEVKKADAESKGYLIEFVRDFNGIASEPFKGQGYHSGEEFSYMAPWTPELLKIYVDEDANVQHFEWRNPLKLTECVSENAPLMGFDDMKEKIKEQLFYTCSFFNGYEDMSMEVQDIDLKMTLIGVKDHPDEAMYVPAWVISYVRKISVNYTDDFGNHITEQEDDAYIVLDAVDGGSVRPFSASMQAVSELED